MTTYLDATIRYLEDNGDVTRLLIKLIFQLTPIDPVEILAPSEVVPLREVLGLSEFLGYDEDA